MSKYKIIISPIGKLQYVNDQGLINFKDAVVNQSALPSVGNSHNDARIATDTGHLYIWNGTAWIDQGDIIDLEWSSINNKPSSSVSDIDDAVNKKHSHSNKTALDNVSGINTGDQNISVKADKVLASGIDGHLAELDSFGNLKDSGEIPANFERVTNKDTNPALGTSDTKYPSQNAVKSYVDALGVSLNTIRDLTLNIMLNAFRIAQQGSLTLLKMVDSFVDEYEDESGIDTVNSINQTYNSTDDYYNPSFGLYDSNTKTLLHFDVSPLIDSANTPGTVSLYGSAVRNISIPKFESGCLECPDSATDYATITGNFSIASKIFTMECWFRMPVVDRICLLNTSPAGSGDFQIYINPTSIYFPYYSSSGWAAFPSPSFSTLSANVWYHLAISGDGTYVYFFLNGQLLGSPQTWPYNPYSNSGLSPIKTGGDGSTHTTHYIDEFRWSNVCRWNSTFSIPTESYKPPVGNMTLKSKAQVSPLVPTSARIILFEEDVDSVTLNTDLKGYISRDNGTTFTQVTLEDVGNYISGARVLQGVVDVSGQPSGSNIKYKIATLNNKNLRIHGTGIAWK